MELTDAGDLVVLVSLPGGTFVRHDAALHRIAGDSAPAAADDLEYLAEVWGFTPLPGGSDYQEVGDVPAVVVLADGASLAVELSGIPWFAAPAAECPSPVSALPDHCLLGICFDVDLAEDGPGDRFWEELAAGRAVLGQVELERKAHSGAAIA